MDTRTATIFLTLAETLHFGRAADSCHMSPSTLTRTIKQLEAEVGAPLFERDNRSVTLTREGELFRLYAIESNTLWVAFQETLLDTAGELSGTLVLYGSVTASYSFMFDLLSKLRKRHPGILITLQTGDPEQAIAQVQSGDAQISIGARPSVLPAAVSFRTIAETPLVFIAPLDDLPPDSRDASVGEPWYARPVILPRHGVARDRVTRWFRRQGIAPDVSALVAGNEAIVSMVSLGGGIGVVPRIVLDNSPIRDRVAILPVSPDLEPLEVGMFALRKHLKNRLVGALWNINDQSSLSDKRAT